MLAAAVALAGEIAMSRSAVFAAIVATVACAAASAKVNAEPMLTISCDKPNGFNIEYGTALHERVETDQKKQPEPLPTLRGPTKNSYLGTPTFIIDSNKTKMTVTWAELPEDVELRQQAKELNIPRMPPPPATEATIVWFSKDQISAIEAGPWLIMTYSFYPGLGTAFIGEQSSDFTVKNTRQLATFAHCEFSWTNPQLRDQQ
jgi:hypothetical protein